VRFVEPLITGRLLRRHQRFCADVRLSGGEVVTAHTPNPGRMIGLLRPGAAVRLSRSHKPSRKLRLTWELVRVGHHWVGVNPLRANALVAEAITAGRVDELGGCRVVGREVAYGSRHSRVDLLLDDPRSGECYLEVKSATLIADGVAMFPDAVTARGRKHLHELADVVAGGQRAVLFMLAQRGDAQGFAPADHIDPAYGESLRAAARAGVEILAYRARVGPREIVVSDPLEVDLGQ